MKEKHGRPPVQCRRVVVKAKRLAMVFFSGGANGTFSPVPGRSSGMKLRTGRIDNSGGRHFEGDHLEAQVRGSFPPPKFIWWACSYLPEFQPSLLMAVNGLHFFLNGVMSSNEPLRSL